MSGAAARAFVTSRRDFALCALDVEILVVEGTVQAVVRPSGLEPAAKAWGNVFCDAATPGELRAIADYLEGLT